MKRRAALAGLGATTVALGAGFAGVRRAQAQAQAITLHGAVQFNDDHAFNKALLKFEELVKQFTGRTVTLVADSGVTPH